MEGTNRICDNDEGQQHPELFPESSKTSGNKIPPDLTIDNATSMVLAYGEAFPEASSQLGLLRDLIRLADSPSTTTWASLIALQPRVDALSRRQDEQAKSISELRVRTAAMLRRWCEVGVVGGGECWVEWEGRLETTEREVRRRENHLREIIR